MSLHRSALFDRNYRTVNDILYAQYLPKGDAYVSRE